MQTKSGKPIWRVGACAEALIALSAGQYLRMPITAQCTDAFRARLGGRVWVDLDTWAVRLDQPPTRVLVRAS